MQETPVPAQLRSITKLVLEGPVMSSRSLGEFGTSLQGHCPLLGHRIGWCYLQGMTQNLPPKDASLGKNPLVPACLQGSCVNVTPATLMSLQPAVIGMASATIPATCKEEHHGRAGICGCALGWALPADSQPPPILLVIPGWGDILPPPSHIA